MKWNRAEKCTQRQEDIPLQISGLFKGVLLKDEDKGRQDAMNKYTGRAKQWTDTSRDE